MKLFYVHLWRVINTSFLLCIIYGWSKISMALLEKSVTGSNNLHLYIIFKFIVGGGKSHLYRILSSHSGHWFLCTALRCGPHHKNITPSSWNYTYFTMARMIVTEHDRPFSTSPLSPPLETREDGAVDEAQACI